MVRWHRVCHQLTQPVAAFVPRSDKSIGDFSRKNWVDQCGRAAIMQRHKISDNETHAKQHSSINTVISYETLTRNAALWLLPQMLDEKSLTNTNILTLNGIKPCHLSTFRPQDDRDVFVYTLVFPHAGVGKAQHRVFDSLPAIRNTHEHIHTCMLGYTPFAELSTLCRG